jgi:hypothetical protein
MLPPQLSADVKSSGERLIFDLLKRDPDTADWVCLHSLGLARHVRRPHGEIDFVVLIPGEGIFCLEIKSGSVARRDGVWYFTNRFGEQSTSTVGPFNQARDGMYTLLEEVRRHFGTRHRFTRFVYGYGVVFPNVAFPAGGPEEERWLVYDRDSRRQPISVYLRELARQTHDKLRSERWYDAAASRPTAADVADLVDHFRGDFELVASARDLEGDLEAQLFRLTQEQYRSLDALELNRRCLFEGGAGTGKTFLAREYARRAADSGQRVLLLCFNRLLGAWLEQQNAAERLAPRVTAGSFHSFLDDLIAASPHREEFRRLQAEAPADLFTQNYPLFGQLALEEGVRQPFDVLVIDEGQDLIRPEYLDLLNLLVAGGLAGGQWAFFCDFQRQALFAQMPADEMLTLLQARAPHLARYRLTINCRNTRPIGEETSLLSGFDTPPFLLAEIAGRPVDYHFGRDAAQQLALLEGVVSSYLRDGLTHAQITLLSPVQRANSCLAGVNHLGGCTLSDLDGRPVSRRGRLLGHTTIQAFKGLENTAIVLHGIDRINDDRSRSVLYVGMSRARERLAVVLTESCRADYQNAVRQHLQRSLTR